MTTTIRSSAPPGRNGEHERAVAAVRPGSGVVIVGLPAAGRSTLAAAVARQAEASGASTVWVAASASLRQVPFGAFASLLHEVPARSNDDHRAVSPADQIATIVRSLRFQRGSAPTTLIVDDLHLLDGWSAEAVLQAVSVRAVGLVATTLSGAPLSGAARRLVDDGFVEVVELEPFDRDAVAAVAGELLGGLPAPSTVELLWLWSDGLPGTLHEIVRAGQDAAQFRIVNGYWWWDGPAPIAPGIAAFAQREIDLLSDEATEALDLIVLGDEIDVDVVERMVNADSLVELERAELIESVQRPGSMSVRSSRAHLSRHRRSSMPSLRRRALARRLLRELPAASTPFEITRSASLHAHADQHADTPIAHQATSILRLSDPVGARNLAEAHHRSVPNLASAVDLIDSHIEVGDASHARALLGHAASLARTHGERHRLAEAGFAVALFADRDPEAALELVERHRQADRPDGTRLILSRSLDGLATLLSARPDLAEPFASEALANDSSEANRLRAGVTIVATLLMQGRTGEARRTADDMLATAERLVGEMPSAYGMLRAEIAFSQLWRGELTRVPNADPLTGRWPAPPLAADATGHQVDWALMAGIVAHFRGEHAEAAARLNEAVVQQAQGKGIFHAEASAWLIVALCDAGRIADATRALRQFPERHLAILPGLHDWAHGVVASARGRTTEAAAALASAARAAQDVGAHLIEARYLVELADRCADDRAIARIDELAQLLDAPLLRALCVAAVARLKGDPVQLLAAASFLDDLGLFARATNLARLAETVAVGAGETSVAGDARRARRSMSRVPTSAPAHPAGLSPREYEVAQLAAGGLADREIASRLVLSVRTIESHLASAYRKLSVSSRADLTAALR